MSNGLKATSPFATIIAHPAYSVYVRVIGKDTGMSVHYPTNRAADIRSIPLDEFWRPSTDFTTQFAKAIKLCKNLKSFTCLATLFHPLFYIANRTGLSELRVVADLSDEQAIRLTNFNAIQSLLLFQSSRNVMNMLPGWSRCIQQTLTSLVLFVSGLLLIIAILLMYAMKVLRHHKR